MSRSMMMMMRSGMRFANKLRDEIRVVKIGKCETIALYSSPYPEEYRFLYKLYVCEFCFNYVKSEQDLETHEEKCTSRFPPGEEIYQKDSISIFEVDGRKSETFCQNLCLLSKLFVEQKIFNWNVEDHLFYVMTMKDGHGLHIVGYFSKANDSFTVFNLGCILVLPPYQKQGFGRMLIDFSYLLSRREGKAGTPEGPLSDQGMKAYLSYWKSTLMEYAGSHDMGGVDVRKISRDTGIMTHDLTKAMLDLGLLKAKDGENMDWKRMVLVRKYGKEASKRRPDRVIDSYYLRPSFKPLLSR